MSAFDTQPESLDGDSSTLQSQRILAAGQATHHDLDFDGQRLRNRLRAKMFGVDASPITIGRFKVLETVGSGGMGVVYSAFDEQLDRRVAVKLLRPSREDDASVGKGRLLREAQALAKLSHPNVVQIYEVGTFNERVFLAMEFLPGPTLREWLLQERPPWTEVLRCFCEAGDGLAAAHREGIIHRDFKPANLLFGADGRVRVVDFGLARAAALPPLAAVPSTSASGPMEAELTQTGELMGTPAYMSPEQARHDGVDARSDQYGFCVALYEGLFGRRPHYGRSSAEVLMAVAEGRVEAPPRGTKVSPRVVRAVMRGLSADPAERFPSMDALLAELRQEPTRGWRWLGGGTLAVAGLGVFLFAQSDAKCPSFDDALADAWGPQRQSEVQTAFAARGATGRAAFERVDARLDAYAHEWTDARQDACEAHQVRREQSAALHDLRVACLLERRAELDALTRAFGLADAEIVNHATSAVAELSPVASCQDVVAVQSEGTTDPGAQALRLRLAEAVALYKAGRYGPAHAEVVAVADDAHAEQATAVEAEARYHDGIIQHRQRLLGKALASFETSAELAEAAGRDDLGARAWMQQARDQAILGQPEQAARSLRVATAKLSRLRRDDAELQTLLLEVRAVVAWQAERFDEAIAAQQAVVDRWRATVPTSDPRLADAIDILGNILSEGGRFAEARLRHQEALGLLREIHGPEHPRVGQVIEHGAVDAWEEKRYDDARREMEQAQRTIEATLGPDAPALLTVHKTLAAIAREQKDFEATERHAQRVLALADIEGAAPGERLDALALLAAVAEARHDTEQAIAYYREYLRHLDATDSHADYRVLALFTRTNLASDLSALGRHAEAEVEARICLTMLAGHREPELQALPAIAWSVVGDAARARSDRDAAIEAYEQGLAPWARVDPTTADERAAVARLRWGLAQVLTDDAPRATELAAQARTTLAAVEPGAKEIGQIDAWSTRTAAIEGP